MELSPIGYVSSTRNRPVDDQWDDETASIVLADPFGPEALFGLAEFSHVEVIFVFDRVPDDKIEHGARHPRGNPDWPLVGIFAQRGKNRPNRIGLTVCQVIGVEDTTLHVAGLDAIDGTPVLDLKPWMAEFGPRGSRRQPEWSADLMTNYW